MEKALLEKNIEVGNEEDHLHITWRVFYKEVKEVCWVAGPMVVVNASTFFLQTITLMMVGHLGKLAQSSTGIAISLCAVTGFSVIVSNLLFYNVRNFPEYNLTPKQTKRIRNKLRP